MKIRDVAAELGVSEPTLRRLRARAHLPARGRGIGYSAQDVATLRATLSSQTIPTERHIEHKVERDTLRKEPTITQSNERDLSAKVERLEGDVERLARWGTHAALAIRDLWRRMPDHTAGDTPGEFPAVQRAHLENETEHLLAEEECKTETFFAEIDERKVTSLEREVSGLRAQEEWLQVTVREALTCNDAERQQGYLQEMARQLGIEVSAAESSVISRERSV